MQPLRTMRERVTKMDVYETPSLFIIVGRQRDSPNRWLLQVHRAPSDGLPTVDEEAHPCTVAECEARLAAVADGPAVCILHAFVLLGMVRFLEGHYMVFVTGRQCVGIITGHAVYRIEVQPYFALHYPLPSYPTTPNQLLLSTTTDTPPSLLNPPLLLPLLRRRPLS